ncbi:MAG TPA: hypothetical protein VGL74_09710 [Terriglobales bacterium]|jgi:hypothetical protein
MTNSAKQSEDSPASQPQTLLEFFRDSPLVGAELDFEREPDYGRDIEMPTAG